MSFCGVAHADGYFDELTIAAVQGDVSRVESLLGNGADPNRETWMGLTPLSAAMRSCRMTVDVLEALIAAGADVEARSGVEATPLMVAWQGGRPDLAEALLAAGADPTARNMYGDTADEYARYFAGDLSQAEFRTLRYTSLGFEPRAARSPGCD
jgi:ankyrin repeat protein